MTGFLRLAATLAFCALGAACAGLPERSDAPQLSGVSNVSYPVPGIDPSPETQTFNRAHEEGLDEIVSALARNRSGGSVQLAAQEGLDTDVWRMEDGAIHHVQSGMKCDLAYPLMESRLTELLIYTARFEKGLDVACHYESDRVPVIMTFFATYAPDVTLEEHIAGAYLAMAASLPNAQPAEMAYPVLGGEKERGIETMAASLSVKTQDGFEVKASVWLAKLKGWHIKARGTYAAEAASMLEVLIGLNWVNKILQVEEHGAQPSEPASSDEEPDITT